MREFLAFPFLMLAKAFAEITSLIDSEPCICFSLRESVEVTEENIDDFLNEIKEDDDD